jgi:hypothetical protein
MNETDIAALREHLAVLRAAAQALAQAAGDFPALDRNLARAQASIKMMSISLGLITADSQGDC